MPLSAAAQKALQSAQTDEVFLECLTITHPTMAEPLRLVNDRQDLARTAGTFQRFPFQITAPVNDEQRMPELRISIDNVDQRIVTAIRSLAGDPDEVTITYEVVLHSSPNTVEYGPIDFRLDGVQNAPQTLQLVCSFHRGFLNAGFPGRLIAPSNAG